jgi:hypothetical protein
MPPRRNAPFVPDRAAGFIVSHTLLKNRPYIHPSGRILAQLFHRTIFSHVHLTLTEKSQCAIL